MAFPQWAWKNPLPQGHDLTSIKVADDRHFYAGGVNGTIMSSRNGGDSWNIFYDSARRTVHSVDFTDSLNGWAVGEKGFRFHTTDGGITWMDRSTDSLDQLFSVTFPDKMHGWICNEMGTAAGSWKIKKTIDGGNTWITCSTPPNASPVRIKFLDTNHGWFSEEIGTNLYCTSDGGITWTAKTVGSNNVDNILDFTFSDPAHGCAATFYEGIRYTSDGGGHWATLTSAEVSAMAVTMDGQNTLYAAGYHSDYSTNPPLHARVSKSSDAGATWTSFDFNEPYNVFSISMGTAVLSDTPVLLIAGMGGAMFRSEDENLTWQSLIQAASLANIGSIYFDKIFPVGWAATENGYILKTSDGGDNWHKVMTGISTPLTSVWFLDTLQGFVAGKKGILLRTIDGGNSWTQMITVNPGFDFVGICFSDLLNGWTISSNGVVFHTGDGGNSWQKIGVAGWEEIFDFTFSDNKHGWAVGKWGTIMATHDGGVHWQNQTSHVEITQIWDVCFTDSLYGWCAVGRGYKIHTTDGGETWLVDGSIYQDAWDHYAVKFFDHHTGYMTGQYYWNYDGFILKTTDGGVTWKEEQISIGNTIHNLFSNDSSAIYGSGWNGTIIKYSGSVLQSMPEKNGKQTLSCFPNPCQEYTSVRITLPSPQPVSIQVYDARGRLVVLINKSFYPPGENTIKVNMKELPDGDYFLRLITAEAEYFGEIVKCSGL